MVKGIVAVKELIHTLEEEYDAAKVAAGLGLTSFVKVKGSCHKDNSFFYIIKSLASLMSFCVLMFCLPTNQSLVLKNHRRHIKWGVDGFG